MKKLILLALLAAPALADIKIRVTDDAGNVATETISGTNRIAQVNEWAAVDGTNTVAAKLATVAKDHFVGWAIEAKQRKVRLAKQAEADTAVEAVEK